MRFLLTFLALFCSSATFSQPAFNCYYTPSNTSLFSYFPVLVRMQDSSLMVVGVNDTNLIVFKTDLSGNMLWMEKVLLDGLQQFTNNFNIVLLADTTVAVMIRPHPNQPGFFLFKINKNGTVLWSNRYNIQFFDGGDMAADEYGGLVVASLNGELFYINPDGSVKKSLTSSKHPWQIVYKGNGVYTIMSGNPPLFKLYLFDVDSNGVVLNNYLYSVVSDSVTLGGAPPFENMVPDLSGGLYMVAGLNHYPVRSYGILHFNSQNQPLWAKKIDANYNGGIVATSDGECLVGAVYNNFPQFYTIFVKFDSTGAVSWTNSPVDLNNNAGSMGFFSMVYDTGNGFYCTQSQPYNMHITHFDALNGFCSSQNLQPTIFNLQVTDSIQPVNLSLLAIIDSAITTTTLPLPWYQYDACTGMLIDSTTSVSELQKIKVRLYPNPVTEILNISLPQKINWVTVNVYSMLGEKIIENKFRNQSELELNFAFMKPGIYIINVQCEEFNFVEKVFKE